MTRESLEAVAADTKAEAKSEKADAKAQEKSAKAEAKAEKKVAKADAEAKKAKAKKAQERGGPYLSAAVFCDKIMKGDDGAMSLIRLIDQMTLTIPADAPPTFHQVKMSSQRNFRRL